MSKGQEVPVIVTNATITFWFKPDHLRAFAKEVFDAAAACNTEAEALNAITYILESRVGRLGVVAEASPALMPRWKWFQFSFSYFKGKTCEEIDPAALKQALNEFSKQLTLEERDVILEYQAHLMLCPPPIVGDQLPLAKDVIP